MSSSDRVASLRVVDEAFWLPRGCLWLSLGLVAAFGPWGCLLGLVAAFGLPLGWEVPPPASWLLLGPCGLSGLSTPKTIYCIGCSSILA